MHDEEIDLCTLGMFIIDEIDYGGTKELQDTIIGGAGTYAVIGARIVAEYSPERIGWIVDIGSDFPPGFQTLIETWETSCIFRTDMTRLTTRAWNGYGPNELRAFRYTTPKLRLDETSLPKSHLFARAFHFVCSPSRCVALVKGIIQRREDGWPECNRTPFFVWEPVPELCTPDEIDNFYRACEMVDVVSPNDSELAAQFGKKSWRPDEEGQSIVTAILRKGIGRQGTGMLVIRAGGQGCYAFRRGVSLRLPAYHQQQSRVIDPTGAGNAFLGALAKALAGTVTPPASWFENMLRESVKSTYDGTLAALAYASVAASFVVEQAGMPQLSSKDDGVEYWNDESLEARLVEYGDRLMRTKTEL